eukprot:tig00020825_g14296.t1
MERPRRSRCDAAGACIRNERAALLRLLVGGAAVALVLLELAGALQPALACEHDHDHEHEHDHHDHDHEHEHDHGTCSAGASQFESAGATAGHAHKELLVEPGERIMDAVRKASPGDTVRLAPGRYVEDVLLDKDIRLIGPRTAVLESDQGDALTLRRRAAPVVKGITIRGTNGYALHISGGSRAVVEDCDIAVTSQRSCVRVEGHYTAPVLRGNEVHDCPGYGVFFFGPASGVVEANDISGTNGVGGVCVSTYAYPVIRKNKMHDLRVGIELREGSDASIDDNALERVRKFVHSEPDRSRM